jgi:formylglycine-generating enzyme required for sulfatase activity
MSEPLDLEMVLVPGGPFEMGSARGRDDEAPPHLVELAPFSIARFAVTNRQYDLFLAECRAAPPPTWNDPAFDDPDQPVVAVSWFDAVAFGEWASRRLGARFRLPTEAERERACRGGATTRFPWGEQPERELGGYGRRWSTGPEVVGGPPNALGLCNLADNVHEWCLDWYAAGYYAMSPRRDPRGPEHGTRRASRGGSWRHQVKVTPSAARSALDPSFRYTDYGFRLVREEG